LAAHLADMQNVVADVDNVISNITVDDNGVCTTLPSVAPSTLECTNVPAACAAADDMDIVEMLNGNYHIICY